MRIKFSYYLFIILFIFSCNKIDKKDDLLVAKVYKSELYQSDINELLDDDTSVYSKKQFVDSWVRNELYASSTKLSNSDLKEIDELTASFERTLIIQKQKQKYLNKNLVTAVDSAELNNAYNDLKETYKLKKDIFKYHLVVIEKSHPDILDMRNFFKKNEFSNFYESLRGNIEYSFLDSSQWHNWFDISLQLPLDEIDETDFTGEMDMVLESMDHIFFLRVLDFIDKTETAPLSYMKRYLENAIVEKRKEKLIEEYSKQLYQSALNNNKIIIN